MKQILLLIIAGVVVAGCSTGYTVTLKETGSNVVATGSGPLNLTGWTPDKHTTYTANGMTPAAGIIQMGPSPSGALNFYTGSVNGPRSFGSGDWPGFGANTGSGDLVGIRVQDFPQPHPEPNSGLIVPLGYVSGNALSDSMTYNNATFDSLGVTPGIYVWTWGTGANFQNFTLIIGPFKWWRWLLPLHWRFPFPEWRSWPPPWPPPRDLPRPISGDRELAK